MAISWLQGDDAAVRAHFTEVERVPKALEVTECVAPLDHLLASLQGSPQRQLCQAHWVSGREQVWVAIWVKGQAAWGLHDRWRDEVRG